MKKYIVTLLVMMSIVGFSQTRYSVYKIEEGDFNKTTGEYTPKIHYVDSMELVLKNNIIYINDDFRIVLHKGFSETLYNMTSVKSLNGIDSKNDECLVYMKTDSLVNGSRYIHIVYGTYLVKYYIKS